MILKKLKIIQLIDNEYLLYQNTCNNGNIVAFPLIGGKGVARSVMRVETY